MKSIMRFGFAIASLLLSLQVQAVSISGLYNTGVDNLGVVLADSAQDSHYNFSVISGDSTGMGLGSSPYAGVGTNSPPAGGCSGFPICGDFWVGNSSVSRWITPTADASASYDPTQIGRYSFTLQFDLTGYDASTAAFSASWAVDQIGYVLFNGSEVASVGDRSSDTAIHNSLGDLTTFHTWHPFGVTSGFLSGLNTLEFMVINPALAAGNPLGLRVEFASSTVERASVPEPESLLLAMVGLLLLGLTRVRKHNAR